MTKKNRGLFPGRGWKVFWVLWWEGVKEGGLKGGHTHTPHHGFPENAKIRRLFHTQLFRKSYPKTVPCMFHVRILNVNSKVFLEGVSGKKGCRRLQFVSLLVFSGSSIIIIITRHHCTQVPPTHRLPPPFSLSCECCRAAVFTPLLAPLFPFFCANDVDDERLRLYLAKSSVEQIGQCKIKGIVSFFMFAQKVFLTGHGSLKGMLYAKAEHPGWQKKVFLTFWSDQTQLHDKASSDKKSFKTGQISNKKNPRFV